MSGTGGGNPLGRYASDQDGDGAEPRQVRLLGIPVRVLLAGR